MEQTHTADMEKLLDLIKDIRVAMMTTLAQDAAHPTHPAGSGKEHPRLHTRPMYTHAVKPGEFDGYLWFFTEAGSEKTREIVADQHVTLTYAAPDKNRYIAVNGVARVERNPEKARELWNVHAKAWWPEGPESPNLALVRVRVEGAEYWDGPSNTRYMLSLAKAVATNTQIEFKADHGVVKTP